MDGGDEKMRMRMRMRTMMTTTMTTMMMIIIMVLMMMVMMMVTMMVITVTMMHAKHTPDTNRTLTTLLVTAVNTTLPRGRRPRGAQGAKGTPRGHHKRGRLGCF